jgi:hypothetical protein
MDNDLLCIQNMILVDGPAKGEIQHMAIGCPWCADCDAWPVTIEPNANGVTYFFFRELDPYRAMAEYSYKPGK